MKPRLTWFSPIPPMRSAIGQYTVGLLRDLARFWEVDLWSEMADAEVDGYKIGRFDRQGATLPWSALNDAEATVYHIGNAAEYHGGIWNVLRQHPGILVLHEVHLADFVAAACKLPEFSQTIFSAVELEFGAPAVEELRSAIGSEDIQAVNERFPFYKIFADRATGVVVHCRAAYEEISQYGGRPCIHLDLPHAAEANLSRSDDSTPGRYNFVVVGHIGWNRLLKPIIEALAQFRDRHDWRFDVYGVVAEETTIRLAIDSLGLGDKAILHGFTSEAELRRALASAHLAFNLRYPTMGEASYSQLTLWNHAVPTIVSDVGWYADLPRGSVYHIDPRRTLPELTRAIATFFAEPARFAEMGRLGRQALEARHSPSGYVERLTEFIAATQGAASAQLAAESMAGTIGRRWREIGLPWRGQGRMADRYAEIINDLTGAT